VNGSLALVAQRHRAKRLDVKTGAVIGIVEPGGEILNAPPRPA
jgi:hypothetical protein